MKAEQHTVRALLGGPSRFLIPVFQRYYVWTEDNWARLWTDILRIHHSPGETHFLGALVSVAHHPEPGAPAPFQVIDGQQRLTTLSVLLCALRDASQQRGLDMLARELSDTMVVHPYQSGDQRYRLFPRQNDRHHYFDIVAGKQPVGTSGIPGAYRYFRRALAEEGLGSEAALRGLFDCIANRLLLVAITLTNESPFRIFRSLNSTGVDLEQSDLVRNHVFMAVPAADQESFDEVHWKPLEAHFHRGSKVDSRAFAGFIRNVLLMDGSYLGRDATYDRFEAIHVHETLDAPAVVAELRTHATRYDHITGRRPHPAVRVRNALSQLRALQASTSWPVALRLLEGEAASTIPTETVGACIEAIGSFVLRRLVCGRSSRAYARWFTALAGQLETHDPDLLFAFLSKKGWPTDRQFRAAFTTMDLFGSKYRRPILDALERHCQHKTEPVSLDHVSIEHVLPRTLSDSPHGQSWREALGPDWKDAHARWLDTPGNLTLVGAAYNGTMSNHRYADKRPVLRKSALALNRWFHRDDAADWTAATIQARGAHLAELATRLWPRPTPQTDQPSSDTTTENVLVDDIVRVLTRRPIAGSLRAILKLLLEHKRVTLKLLHSHVATGTSFSGVMAALTNRINYTPLRSTGGKPGIKLFCEVKDGAYLRRPELISAMHRIPTLHDYLRTATWEEVAAERQGIAYSSD